MRACRTFHSDTPARFAAALRVSVFGLSDSLSADVSDKSEPKPKTDTRKAAARRPYRVATVT